MLNELIDGIVQLLSNPLVLLFCSITLVEVAPIKLNPWKWLGNLILGDVRKDMTSLRDEITDMKVQNWRWNVLDFANSCRNNRRHSKDEWDHTITQLAEYERYIERNDITNGVFEEDAIYLREEYHKHKINNDFL